MNLIKQINVAWLRRAENELKSCTFSKVCKFNWQHFAFNDTIK